MTGERKPYSTSIGAKSEEDYKGILHPIYRRYSFGVGFSWEKIVLFYSQPQYRWSLFGAIFSFGILLSTIAYVGLNQPRDFTPSFFLLLATIHALLWCISTLRKVYRAREIYHRPPKGGNATTGLPSGNLSPSTAFEGQVALNARVIHHDRTVEPEQIVAISPQEKPVCAEFTRIPQSDNEVVISYINGILRDGGDSEGVIHSLAATEIHELTHWALSNKANRNLGAVHSHWDDIIEEQVEYIME